MSLSILFTLIRRLIPMLLITCCFGIPSNDSSESAAQIQAFDDTWHWNIDSERAYREVVQDGRRGYVGGGCCGWRYGGWLHSWFGIPAFAGMTGGGGPE